MQSIRRHLKRLAGMLLAVVMTFCLLPQEEAQAATRSYTDPVAFYNSFVDGTNHFDYSNGGIWFGTRGNLASSGNRWATEGWEITVSAGGASVTVTVAYGGKYFSSVNERITGGYYYNLYCIKYDDLMSLVKAKNATAYNTISQQNTIKVSMTAILRTTCGSKSGFGGISTPYTKDSRYASGYISGESGNGNVSVTGKLFYLSNSSDLAALTSMFSTSSRNSWDAAYIDVTGHIQNHTLTVIYRSNNKVIEGSAQTCKMLGTITTKPLSVAGASAGKTCSAWVQEGTNAAFSPNTQYFASSFSSRLSEGNQTVYLDAGWGDETYGISYDANGGSGSKMPDTIFKSSEPAYVRPCTYYKTGYYCKGWSTTPTGGVEHYGGQYIQNAKPMTLYAVWEPMTYQISLEPVIYAQEYQQNGTYTLQGVKKSYIAGTSKFFEVYEHLLTTGDLYSSKSQVTKSSTARSYISTTPSKTGYDFLGYYKTLAGATSGQVINSGGSFTIGSSDYRNDSVSYAVWDPYVVTITFDQQSGAGGTKTAKATYDQPYPSGLTAPIREGWSFKGYYTQPDGKGVCIYNDAMSPTFQMSDLIYDLTLYAYWVDDIPPTVSIDLSAFDWTNIDIDVMPAASDYGTGLASVELTWIKGTNIQSTVIFYDNISSGDKVYNKFTDYTEENELADYVIHTVEGAYTYVLKATDVAGNSAEYRIPVYLDKTAPKIHVTTDEEYTYITTSDFKE